MSVVDDYLGSVEPTRRVVLERIREVVLELVPYTEECISYNMPAFRVHGKVVLGFLSCKKHMSIYPFSGKTIATLGDKLGDFVTTTGSVHFTVERPIPEPLLRDIIATRLREIGAKGVEDR